MIQRKINWKAIIAPALVMAALQVNAQSNDQNGHDPSIIAGQEGARVLTTAVPFLIISPDARASGMGDVGAATTPDNNSIYWNPAKMAFIDKDMGFTISYTPWLGKIIDDMSVSYLSGFKKITREQAIGIELKYFDLGEIVFTENATDPGHDFNPKEYAFGLSYSRVLVENTLGIGINARYVYSNLTGNVLLPNTFDAKPGQTVAADVGVYYNKDLLLSGTNSNISFGAVISNIGAKVTYSNDEYKEFIPTNLRLGTAFTTNLDPYNSLTFGLDFNKLLVPTPPIYDENDNIIAGKNPDRTLLSGIFGSFSDAPNGLSEELKEVMVSVGGEYWYNDVFAARMGYFWEHREKGDRKFFSLGLGFRYQVFGIDFAYLIPKNEHPLAETLRFSMVFNWEGSNDRTVKE